VLEYAAEVWNPKNICATHVQGCYLGCRQSMGSCHKVMVQIICRMCLLTAMAKLGNPLNFSLCTDLCFMTFFTKGLIYNLNFSATFFLYSSIAGHDKCLSLYSITAPFIWNSIPHSILSLTKAARVLSEGPENLSFVICIFLLCSCMLCNYMLLYVVN